MRFLKDFSSFMMDCSLLPVCCLVSLLSPKRSLVQRDSASGEGAIVVNTLCCARDGDRDHRDHRCRSCDIISVGAVSKPTMCAYIFCHQFASHFCSGIAVHRPPSPLNPSLSSVALWRRLKLRIRNERYWTATFCFPRTKYWAEGSS